MCVNENQMTMLPVFELGLSKYLGANFRIWRPKMIDLL